MNRRRTTTAGRKKSGRKKPVKRDVDKQSPQARKRPARKNAAVKKRTSRKAAHRVASKPASRTKSRRPRTAKGKTQNRRRPAPKAAKQTGRTSWGDRARLARENLGGWMLRSRNQLRNAAKALGVGLGLAAMWWIGAHTVAYARSTEAFAIQAIEVQGNQQLKDIDVRRAAGLQVGSNIFEVSLEDARNRLMQHPWVQKAEVFRRLPGRMRIELVERTPVALVALDQLYLVSDRGAVFKRLGVDDPVDVPVITGIASERFYDDLDYRTDVLLGSMALLQDYEGAGLANREPVSEIHFDGANGVELFIGSDGMNVRLGNGQHRQKLRRLRRVLERLEREKTRPSYVYLDNVRSPERVTVHIP
jgi:cell division protein FtsQ